VDQAFAAKLAKASPLIKLSGVGHTPSAERPEHALEVQLPFLQRVLGQFQLVPVIMGDQSYDACRALGVALAKLVAGTNTLIVASSDLSHYHTYDEAVRLDHKTLKAIEEYDYFDLSRNLDLRVWEACGGGPIVATMIAAERLGATQAKLLHYANSGDTTGDHSRVVGYGAVALVKAQLQYEVSVLSPLRRVLDVKEIEVGKHGLVMRHGDQEGLLLPQVPVEEKWNRLTFLEQTCRKAGLPADAWKDPDTDIFMFTALVFGDH
jgi:hypothetical protein